MSSLSTQIVTYFQIAGIASGGYLGWRHNNQLKTMIYDKIPYIKDRMIKYPEQVQKNTIAILGITTGVYLGYHLWPLALAGAGLQIQLDN